MWLGWNLETNWKGYIRGWGTVINIIILFMMTERHHQHQEGDGGEHHLLTIRWWSYGKERRRKEGMNRKKSWDDALSGSPSLQQISTPQTLVTSGEWCNPIPLNGANQKQNDPNINLIEAILFRDYFFCGIRRDEEKSDDRKMRRKERMRSSGCTRMRIRAVDTHRLESTSSYPRWSSLSTSSILWLLLFRSKCFLLSILILPSQFLSSQSDASAPFV